MRLAVAIAISIPALSQHKPAAYVLLAAKLSGHHPADILPRSTPFPVTVTRPGHHSKADPDGTARLHHSFGSEQDLRVYCYDSNGEAYQNNQH